MTQLAFLGIGPAPIEDLHRRFEERHGSYMEGCRAVLYELAQVKGEVSSDDFWRLIRKERIPPLPEDMHHNAVGALFRDERFEATGRLVRSTRPEAKGNLLRTWRAA